MNYKKCPYCDLNYIPLNDFCCEVCYENSPIAKQDAISRKSEQKKTEELNARKNLLTLWKSLGFIGFLHTANFDNFVSIYKSNFLKSRNQLLSEGFVFKDNAETGVLEKTYYSIKSKVRFYYRPITPTNISAFMWHNQKNPVMIVFDENLIFDNDVLFCDGCAGSKLTTITKTAKNAMSFNWQVIFEKGPFNSNDAIVKNHRNAEFLISSPLNIQKATKFYFRNFKDYIQACQMFGKDPRFELKPKLFY